MNDSRLPGERAGVEGDGADQAASSVTLPAPGPACLCRRAGGHCLTGNAYCLLLDQLGASDPVGAVQRAQAEHRRYAALAARALDRMLTEGYSLSADPWECTGEHHPGLPCDPWGPCSGAAYTYTEHRALRVEVAA